MKLLLSKIATICGGKFSGKDSSVECVITDSRNYNRFANALFVAMNGVNHNSHDYIQDMYDCGIRAFIVEQDCELNEDCGYIKVDNSLLALQSLARYNRKQFSGKVIAIGGSNGKTIVKEWIGQLAPFGVKIYRSPRSYNSQLGVALSLIQLDMSAEYAFIEAGISTTGEMERLNYIIGPDVAIFTSFGDAHAEGFVSAQQKAEQKAILARGAKTIIAHSYYKTLFDVLKITYPNTPIIDSANEVLPNIVGQAWQRNGQIVCSLFSLLNWDRPNFDNIRPLAMREEVISGKNNSLIINDTYNADLSSLDTALDNLTRVGQNRRKIVILTDLHQCNSENLYARVAQMLTASKVDLLIGIGQKMCENRTLFRCDTKFFATTNQLLAQIDNIDVTNSVILVKGNREAHTELVSHCLEQKTHTTVLEVNLSAMERNINYFRKFLKSGVKLTAMVKASSYGAGDTDVARMLQRQGVDYLAVAFADEGVVLRQGGITMPIIVLNADDGSFDTMVSLNLEPEIYSFRSLESFCNEVRHATKQNYPIHIALDTGMHRLGFNENDIDKLLAMLDKYADCVKVASVFAHFCVSDDTTQDDFTKLQISRFDKWSSKIIAHFPYKIIRHTAASAGMVRFKEAQFDMCRLGLGLYGYGYEHNEQLEPVSTLRTKIVQIHNFKSGESVGYGRSQFLTRDSRIATIPIGYADGLNRHLGGGKWSMIVCGQKAPIVGRVCMDSCMIDVTDIKEAEEGEVVTIFSAQKGNTAEDMAQVLDTIPYEVLTWVGKRVKRIYIED